MTGLWYLLGGYLFSLLLLWGYAAILWRASKRLESLAPVPAPPRD